MEEFGMSRPIAAAALALLTAGGAHAQAGGCSATSGPGTAALVELYTSEGCSSCPPADRWLSALRASGLGPDRLVPLSLHVDYWDYIGWKDRYASPAWTDRQKAYAGALELRTLYTPQMVIDGRVDAVGSDRSNVSYLIDRAAALPKLELTLDSSGSRHVLHLPEARFSKPATVWLVIYDPEQRTQVNRGENAGSTLSEYNIVRDLRKLASWDGKATTIDLNLAAMGKGQACAVLVQGADQGPILAALQVPAW
jgi:hypothetical protein